MIYASILWVALTSLTGCLLALTHGSLTPTISLVALIGSFLFATYAKRRMTFGDAAALEISKEMSLPIILLYAIIGIGIYFHSVFLFFQKDQQFWIQNPFNLGDMSFHWGTIRYLAKGAHFWPENPIFMGHRFRYPFGMDFFNACFESLRVPIETHLPLVTLGGLALIFATLHRAGGPLLVFAVFFSGGLFNIFQSGPWDLTQIQAGIDFKNLFLTVLLTQRGFLYALPAVLFLYQALQKSFANTWTPSTFEKVTFGIIWGALGFFHLHSFFLASVYLGSLILWHRQLQRWFITVLISGLIGGPFVLNALWPEAGTSSLVHWSGGWARAPEVNYLEYWLQNMGPWIVAVIGALYVFYKNKDWNRFIPLALSFGLFALFSHLMLAPWDWDNIKLILWCYIFALLALSDWLWNERDIWTKAIVAILFFTPGFLLFVHSMPLYSHGISWASTKELNKSEVLLAKQDVNLGMAIDPAYDHTVLLLGYKLYMGYPGHVWSHGYNYLEREALLDRYFKGDTSTISELLNDHVQLIYQGPLEKHRESGWQMPPGLKKVGEAADHELYKIE